MVVTLLTERTRADFFIETVRVEWSPKRTQKIKTPFHATLAVNSKNFTQRSPRRCARCVKQITTQH